MVETVASSISHPSHLPSLEEADDDNDEPTESNENQEINTEPEDNHVSPNNTQLVENFDAEHETNIPDYTPSSLVDEYTVHDETDNSTQTPGEKNSTSNTEVENQVSAGRKRKVVQENQRIVKSKTVCLPACKEEKIKLKKGDNIVIELEGESIQAKVTGRDKVTGKFYNYFNIEDARGLAWNVNLEQAEWRHPESEEDCLLMMIPKHRHGEKDCRDAKKTELEKLKKFDTVTEVKDHGQFRISSTWVLWVKEMPGGASEVRARLVARGYEEKEEIISDSPTIDQVNIKILLAVAVSKGWKVVSSDVKSAFLQGKEITRNVIMKPPPEAGTPKGVLWKLNVALYGLDDASLQFHFKCKEIFEKLGLSQSKLDPSLF